MKTMAVDDIKTNFPKILEEVKQGRTIGILYGRNKKPVAMIVPCLGDKVKEREIGILDGKMNIEFKDGFEMTTEELLEMR
jgi:antitoxin (DNA-binding transcriptional repressor) of toxin-antitoxin stability system